MNLPYEAFIALRYLRAKRKQAFISVITIISVAGVAIGVMALILVQGVMTGFTDDLRNKILGTNSHVVITAYGSSIAEYRQVMQQIGAVPDVVAATPFILNQVMLSTGSSVSGVVLHGIDTLSAPKVTDIKKFLVDGELKQLDGEVAAEENATASRHYYRPGACALACISPGSPLTVISPTGLLLANRHDAAVEEVSGGWDIRIGHVRIRYVHGLCVHRKCPELFQNGRYGDGHRGEGSRHISDRRRGAGHKRVLWGRPTRCVTGKICTATCIRP